MSPTGEPPHSSSSAFGGHADRAPGSLIDGVLAIATGARLRAHEQKWLHVLEGFVGVGVGLAVFLWTGMTTILLVDLIGVWAALTGVFEIVMAIRLRRELPGELLLGVAGGASIVLGVLMLLWPMTGAFVIVVLLGCYALFFGMAILMLAMRLRRLTPRHERFSAAPGARHGVV